MENIVFALMFFSLGYLGFIYYSQKLRVLTQTPPYIALSIATITAFFGQGSVAAMTVLKFSGMVFVLHVVMIFKLRLEQSLSE